jgi:cytochrome b subunit of formate dehydrogenase
MAATTTPTSEPVLRFDRVERVVHWTNAVLFFVCLVTAAMLYVGPLSGIVGRRDLVKDVHVWAGVALPVPLVLGWLLSPAFRADVHRINRWTPHDTKFNRGQKLNAAFTAGAIIVMLATGYVMRWFEPFPLDWRTGATFVHDWLAAALVVTITGHIVFALRDGEGLRAMLRGR